MFPFQASCLPQLTGLSALDSYSFNPGIHQSDKPKYWNSSLYLVRYRVPGLHPRELLALQLSSPPQSEQAHMSVLPRPACPVSEALNALTHTIPTYCLGPTASATFCIDPSMTPPAKITRGFLWASTFREVQNLLRVLDNGLLLGALLISSQHSQSFCYVPDTVLNRDTWINKKMNPQGVLSWREAHKDTDDQKEATTSSLASLD